MEKLFETNEVINLEKFENIISFEVNDDIINNEADINQEKWAIYPAIHLESDIVREKLIEFIKYVDEITISKFEKISLVLSLVYVIVKYKFDISNIDINNIYLLINYLDKYNLDNSVNNLSLINDEELLYEIRCFSLDISVREKLLAYVIKNKFSKDDLTKMISDNSYYEVLERIK